MRIDDPPLRLDHFLDDLIEPRLRSGLESFHALLCSEPARGCHRGHARRDPKIV
jgi:hypothetical protein